MACFNKNIAKKILIENSNTFEIISSDYFNTKTELLCTITDIQCYGAESMNSPKKTNYNHLIFNPMPLYIVHFCRSDI